LIIFTIFFSCKSKLHIMKRIILAISHLGGYLLIFAGILNKDKETAFFGILVVFSSFILDIIIPNEDNQETRSSNEKDNKILIPNKYTLPNLPINVDQSESKIVFDKDKQDWSKYIIAELLSFNTVVDMLIHMEKIEDVKYSDLLNLREWKFKRLEILVRDNFTCCDCSCKSKSNHAHHLYYILNEFPWAIESSGLITLCNECHKKRHENTSIDIFKYHGFQLVRVYNFYEDLFCSRCNGTGHLPQFDHVQHGVCFKCWGGSVNSSVFKKRLSNFYNNEIDYYDVELLNHRIFEFVYSIDLDKFKNFNKIFPNNDSNSSKNYSDDLPF
jgi:hypothetical protein